MKEISITKNKVVLVDDDDYEWLSKHKWYAFRPVAIFYAARHISGGKSISMHREIMGLFHGDGKIVDHINRNGLDNRKENLRIASRSLNGHNCKLQSHNTSGYRGVFYNKRDKTFQAQIKFNRNKIHCGSFKNVKDAARAYDQAAKKYHGNNAILNFPEERV